MIYHKEMLEIHTSTELNEFGKRYHDIMVETGRGIITKNRANGTITDDRTNEQIGLVNKIVTSMLPVLERAAFSLTTVGFYKNSRVNLKGINTKRMRSEIPDIVNEGARYAVGNFHAYEPDRTKGGSVYSFVLSTAAHGMATYILKNIPNSTVVFRKIGERSCKGLSTEEVFEDLPYITHISLTEILDEVEGETRDTFLEREYLTSDSNPEEEVISKITGEHIPRVVEEVLSTLNPREREILERRRGLNGYDKTILDILGKIFKISKERVRQIDVSTLKNLRERVPKELIELVR